jgi:hypothetical protein
VTPLILKHHQVLHHVEYKTKGQQASQQNYLARTITRRERDAKVEADARTSMTARLRSNTSTSLFPHPNTIFVCWFSPLPPLRKEFSHFDASNLQ